MGTVDESRKGEVPVRPARPRGLLLASWSAELRILLVAVLLAAYFEFANHDFLLTNASLVNLSQFIAPVAPHAKLGFAALGLSFVATGLTWCLVLALAGAAIGTWLRARPRFGAWLDRICGAVFVGLGIRLALQQRA